MSYPQFGYTYPSANSSLNSSQLLVPSGTLSASLTPTSSPSCDSPSSRLLTSSDASPPSGGTVNHGSMYSASGLLSYPRVAGLADTVYSSAYASQGYVPFGADPSAFYSPLNPDNTDAWRSLSGTAGWPYDPNGMASYPYGTSYGGLDVRRKNATRESTSTLKAWLYEHIKNPYPTKGEKIMLAIITKMTLTQVSTWFANARRRLKKENKMQWSPRNRSGDDDDHKSDDDNDDNDNAADSNHGNDSLRDGHHSNNNNNSKVGETEVTSDNDLGGVTNFSSLIHRESSQKDMLAGSHSNTSGNHGLSLLENGQRGFVNTQQDSDNPLHGLRRDDDEDIIVDGGEADPLSRLDFSDPNGLGHHRLKADTDPHHQHKLESFEDSSHLSTPLGSPSIGDSLLGLKSHVTGNMTSHCSTNDVTAQQHGNISPLSKGVTQDCDNGVKPRIWSLADVATSSTPPPGRRSPNSISSSIHHLGLNTHSLGLGGTKPMGSLTAFSSPASQCHNSSGFQPWVNGSYPNVTASHTPSGLSYSYPINPHPTVGASGAHMGGTAVQRTSDLGGHTLGGIGLAGNGHYQNKLSSGYIGEKPSLSQFTSGFGLSSDHTHTAFKPVAKRL